MENASEYMKWGKADLMKSQSREKTHEKVQGSGAMEGIPNGVAWKIQDFEDHRKWHWGCRNQKKESLFEIG